MANLTSGREYFKNIIKETYQQTGAIGALETISERNSFVSSVKQFEAGYVVNWQTILYPLLNGVNGSEYKKFAGVRSGPWAEYDGLDPQYGGLSGWTLTAEPWATADGLECLWDKGKAQPNSITAALYCLSSKIDEIEILSNKEVEPYDDSELRSQIICLTNDFTRMYKDAIGCNVSLKCSSEKTLEFSLLRHIYELFDQVIDGGPEIPFTFDCEKDYPELSIKLLVSNLIYDVLIDQKYIKGLTGDLECIREWIGMIRNKACVPSYGKSSDLNYIRNGDNLVEAIFKLDQAIQSNSVNLQEAYDAGDTASTLPGYIEVSTPGELGSTPEGETLGGSVIIANHRDPINWLLESQAALEIAETNFGIYLVDQGLLTENQVEEFFNLGGLFANDGQTYISTILTPQQVIDLMPVYQGMIQAQTSKIDPIVDLLGDAAHFQVYDMGRKLGDDSVDGLRRSNEIIRVEEHPVSRGNFIDTKLGGPLYPNGEYSFGSVNIRRSVLNAQPRSDVPNTMQTGVVYGGELQGEDETAIWVASGFTSDFQDYVDCNGEPVGDNNLYFRKPGNGTIYKLNTCGAGGSETLEGLTDVGLEVPQMGDLLAYNSTADQWQNTTLSLEKNVDVDSGMSPGDGQVLVWDGTADQWTAGDQAAGAPSQGAAGVFQLTDGSGAFVASSWVESNGSLIPSADNTCDIGSATKKVRDLYVSPNSINIAKSNGIVGPADYASIGTDGIIGNLEFKSLGGDGSTDYRFNGGDNAHANLLISNGSTEFGLTVGSMAQSLELKLPVTMGVQGQVLALNANVNATKGELEWKTLPDGSGGLNAVVEDTAPQLGGNLDAQSFAVTNIDHITFDTSAGYPVGSGEIAWNLDEDTLDIGSGASVLQVGQEMHINVRNNTAGVLENGTAVMTVGTVGNSGRMLVEPMIADGSVEPGVFVGITTESIAGGADGKITTFGKVRHLNTTGTAQGEVWADGDILWLDPQNPGAFTKVQPEAPNLKIASAYVMHAHSNGTIFVRVNSGIDLHNNHRVQVANLQGGDLLHWNPVTTRWENSSIIAGSNNILVQSDPNDGSLTIDNLSPDQVVSITGTGAATVSGDYPNFTVNSTDTDTTYTAGAGLTLNGTEFENTAPDQVVSLTGSGATTVTGTYPNFTISSTDTNTNTQLSTEQVQDIVGGMVSGNSETGIDVTYNDGTGKLDFNVTASGSGMTTLTQHVDYAKDAEIVIDPHNIINIYAFYSGQPNPGSVSFDRTSTVNGGWQNGDRFKIVNLSTEQSLTFNADPMVIVGSTGEGTTTTGTTLSPGKSVEGYWDNSRFYVFEL